MTHALSHGTLAPFASLLGVPKDRSSQFVRDSPDSERSARWWARPAVGRPLPPRSGGLRPLLCFEELAARHHTAASPDASSTRLCASRAPRWGPRRRLHPRSARRDAAPGACSAPSRVSRALFPLRRDPNGDLSLITEGRVGDSFSLDACRRERNAYNLKGIWIVLACKGDGEFPSGAAVLLPRTIGCKSRRSRSTT